MRWFPWAFQPPCVVGSAHPAVVSGRAIAPRGRFEGPGRIERQIRGVGRRRDEPAALHAHAARRRFQGLGRSKGEG
jgi:hypothetical protein